MNQAVAAAPGKIILFGEHAVVYGRMALAAPVTQVLARATVSPGADPLRLEAPGIGLSAPLQDLGTDHPLRLAVELVCAELQIRALPGGKIYIESSIPVASGLGSGAAVTVALMRALSTALGQPLADERVCSLAYEVEKVHHGTPSGIDNTVITYAKPVRFLRGEPIRFLSVGSPFTIVIADSGIPALTRTSVSAIRQMWQAGPELWEAIFDRIGALAAQAEICISAGHWRALGSLMDANQALLAQMTLSHPMLDRLASAARLAGALGAKLSGSGRGGNLIALAEAENASHVAESLLHAGAKHTIITTIA